ncbi:hypothetical protein [Vineibacter terrae]|uniref:Uncharacterized protein n=1 Tax=Vineibacter terrae TaxID=2586908 RepID=A0A5C8PJP7_9HYPH|nr:hypothetical protein [Vineibacter terrae]TXL73744.1 hypothetical protein FHP25_20275 [Vineibacter terrae]HEX2885455.1 hypothetical protein [Vineibacter terrae]
MLIPKLGDDAAAQAGLALVCKLMDALVAKRMVTRAEIDDIFDAVADELSQDQRAWAEDLIEILKA